jgi:dihydrofolate reductase
LLRGVLVGDARAGAVIELQRRAGAGYGTRMPGSKLRLHLTMSLDGFVAGPEQSAEHPLGLGGMALHEWAFPLAAWRTPHGLEGGAVNASTPVVEYQVANVGAVLMGRNMFGPHRGPWSVHPWNGWWGDDPPFHTPVFVLTHHPRQPLPMQGGTTFHFVTEGIESALEQASHAAAGKDVVLAGGANIAQQYLAARLIDEVNVAVVPLLLSEGARLFDNLGTEPPRLEQIGVVEAPGVTHLKYRVVQ